MAIVPRLEKIQYNGTNSQDVLDFLSDVTLYSETGGVLSFEDNLVFASVVLNTNDILIRMTDSNGDRKTWFYGSPAAYANRYEEV